MSASNQPNTPTKLKAVGAVLVSLTIFFIYFFGGLHLLADVFTQNKLSSLQIMVMLYVLLGASFAYMLLTIYVFRSLALKNDDIARQGHPPKEAIIFLIVFSIILNAFVVVYA